MLMVPPCSPSGCLHVISVWSPITARGGPVNAGDGNGEVCAHIWSAESLLTLLCHWFSEAVVGSQLPIHEEMPLNRHTHLHVSIPELNPPSLKVWWDKGHPSLFGWIQEIWQHIWRAWTMAGPETTSGHVWDRHTCTDRCCVCKVLILSIDKTHLTLARSFVQEYRLLYPPRLGNGETPCL